MNDIDEREIPPNIILAGYSGPYIAREPFPLRDYNRELAIASRKKSANPPLKPVATHQLRILSSENEMTLIPIQEVKQG